MYREVLRDEHGAIAGVVDHNTAPGDIDAAKVRRDLARSSRAAILDLAAKLTDAARGRVTATGLMAEVIEGQLADNGDQLARHVLALYVAEGRVPGTIKVDPFGVVRSVSVDASGLDAIKKLTFRAA